MSIKCMTRVWDDSSQKGGALLLLLAIADFADDAGYAFPAETTLASKIRMSPRHTRRMIAGLEQVRELFVARDGWRNGYVVTVGLTDAELVEVMVRRFELTPVDAALALREWRETAEAQQLEDILSPSSGPDTGTFCPQHEDILSPTTGQDVPNMRTFCPQHEDIAVSSEPSGSVMNRHSEPSIEPSCVSGSGAAGITGRDPGELWAGVLELLGWGVADSTFDQHFRGSRAIRQDDGVLLVEVRNRGSPEWLRHAGLQIAVQTAVRKVCGDGVRVEFVAAGGAGDG